MAHMRMSCHATEYNARYTPTGQGNYMDQINRLMDKCKKVEDKINSASTSRDWRRVARLKDLLGRLSYRIEQLGKGYYE